MWVWLSCYLPLRVEIHWFHNRLHLFSSQLCAAALNVNIYFDLFLDDCYVLILCTLCYRNSSSITTFSGNVCLCFSFFVTFIHSPDWWESNSADLDMTVKDSDRCRLSGIETNRHTSWPQSQTALNISNIFKHFRRSLHIFCIHIAFSS